MIPNLFSRMRMAVLAVLLSSPALTPAQSDALRAAASHFDKRVQQFREENVRIAAEDSTTHTGYIAFVGDSLTEAFPLSLLFPKLPTVNRGIVGDIVGEPNSADPRGILRRLNESVHGVRPRHIFLLMGVNDLGDGTTGETLEGRHRHLIEQLTQRVPATSITLQSLLPVRGRFVRLEEAIHDSNRRLKALAAEKGIGWVDLTSALSDQEGRLREEFTNDGLHLNYAAYEAWAAVLRPELERLGLLEIPRAD
jgi:lysophospholipase L1-like esterase